MSTSRIDECILAVVGERWTKVAMAIAKVTKLMQPGLPAGDEECEAISRRIDGLISSGILAARGDTSNWRFSEVRRAKREA